MDGLVLCGIGGLLQRLLLLLDLFGQLLGDSHELAGHHVLALQLDLTGQPDCQEGLEHQIGRDAFPNKVDSNLLPLIGQLLSKYSNIVAHPATIHDPVRDVPYRTS